MSLELQKVASGADSFPRGHAVCSTLTAQEFAARAVKAEQGMYLTPWKTVESALPTATASTSDGEP